MSLADALMFLAMDLLLIAGMLLVIGFSGARRCCLDIEVEVEKKAKRRALADERKRWKDHRERAAHAI